MKKIVLRILCVCVCVCVCEFISFLVLSFLLSFCEGFILFGEWGFGFVGPAEYLM